MKKLTLILFAILSILGVSGQERRPIDNRHPLWMMHIDVWNSADPQKIIDLIPDDIKPYVCMNLSVSSSYDYDDNMFKMPRNAILTYKSWATVCQKNGMWFTCQPASGGHTHIPDNDLETFEYFFQNYPNFLGWNYAEQFWGFDEEGDPTSSNREERIALFAKLVEMSHQYGGFLTVSYCGNIWSHNLNPIAMLKSNDDLMQACQNYPEAILWLYKYTTSGCFYNNESVTWGPFVSGLAKNYGVRYDQCGWNGALDAILGENHGLTYPGSAGIGTVMEQTCVNGGAVWDGPELIWDEDFQNLPTSTVDGYTHRNWGIFPNFDGIWLDMWRKVIDGTMYIPTREEVVAKTNVVVVNDVNSGSAERQYGTWADLYDGLYKQEDPFNRDGGQWMNNSLYLKSTGRYGAIPVVTGLYDDAASAIALQVNKSNYQTLWGNETQKQESFNNQYPEVSTGDLYVNRYKNQLVTYYPYSYLNGKESSSASIPLHYNTCNSLLLNYAKLSSGLVKEYNDHIDFYLNNFRSDSTRVQTETIRILGVTNQPSFKLTQREKHTAVVTDKFDSSTGVYTLTVNHMGPLDLRVYCSGNNQRSNLSQVENSALPLPKQPAQYTGELIIEAENMDYKRVQKVAITSSSWWAPEYSDFAGLGYVEMGTNKEASLKHRLPLKTGGEYNIVVRYCNTSAAGPLQLVVNDRKQTVQLEQADINEWKEATITTNLKAGANTLIINNTGGIASTIDQIIYIPTDGQADYPPTSGIEELTSSYQPVKIYSLDGTELHSFRKGLNIVVEADGSVKKVMIK